MKKILALLSIATLTGCGTVSKTSGAMQVGPDTFQIMARAPVGNQVESQKMAFSEANAHCAAMNKKLMTTNTRSSKHDGFQVTFRCLKDGDPDLYRPNLQKPADTVIEVR